MSIYAVNGKAPIAAWIPSLDTAGNGTTTLSDLVGSNNGTLTNMDAATDWVADTDSGGVRALDFDGVNDHVLHSGDLGIFDTGVWSVSFWVYHRSGTPQSLVGFGDSTVTNRFWYAFTASGALQINLVGPAEGGCNITAGSLPSGQWCHIAISMSASGLVVYKDGVSAALTVLVGANNQKTWSVGQLNRNALAALVRTTVIQFFNGRQDDIRIFDQALDAADVSALYASGLGRGITFGGTIQTRRRRSLAGYGL